MDKANKTTAVWQRVARVHTVDLRDAINMAAVAHAVQYGTGAVTFNGRFVKAIHTSKVDGVISVMTESNFVEDDGYAWFATNVVTIGPGVMMDINKRAGI